MKLNVFIAKTGFCARRKADIYIKKGQVSVNKKMVLEPWHEVKDRDLVTVDGKPVRTGQNLYVAVNKPSGITVTMEDKHAEKKISDVVPEKFSRLLPAGRLDKNAHGLLIQTNDGDLIYRLTHPKFGVEKEYVAIVRGQVSKEAVEKIKGGIKDEDDMLKVKSCVIKKSDINKTELNLVVSEGKKRHIRRLLKNVGFSVMDLKRIRIGGLLLGELKDGHFRELSREGIYRLALGVKV